MARPLGSENKDKPFKEALRLAICDAEKNPRILRRIADQLLKLATDGDVSAIKEVADRLDGKTTQSVNVAGADGGPIMVANATDKQRARALASFVARTKVKQG